MTVLFFLLSYCTNAKAIVVNHQPNPHIKVFPGKYQYKFISIRRKQNEQGELLSYSKTTDSM